ncbi:dienelactone hydrolase family protein [Arthrobacter sp. Z4-13]
MPATAAAMLLLGCEGGTANLDRDAVPGALTQAGAQRHVAGFKAAGEYLRGQDFVDGERIAMTGYCFGGGITWQAATELDGLKATAAACTTAAWNDTFAWFGRHL